MTLGGPFAGPAPRWFSIPSWRPFVVDLAKGLHEALSPFGPERIADVVLLVPTRRGARALAEAFLSAAPGEAAVLPQIRPVGDLEEGESPFEPGELSLDLPPAIDPLRRRFELARLIVEKAPPPGRSLDAASALDLADVLAAFLDSVQIEEVLDPDRIAELAAGDHAEHWRKSAEFLAVATRHWPGRLAELGLTDPTERRVRLLRRLAEQWSERPPRTPVVAAGSTGAAPATADLLAVVASAPAGLVVLPGLDHELDDAGWGAVGPEHPQGTLRKLLDRHGLTREAVRPWPVQEDPAASRRGRARRRLVNEALRPAAATDDWLEIVAGLSEGGDGNAVLEGLQGVRRLAARNEDEGATAAALLLRETLETAGATAALVTPDQAFARRVSARLARWGVEADSSAGAPLAAFPTGILISLAARLAADPGNPSAILSVLKNPLTRLGREPAVLERERRTLERYGLRGVRPRDVDGLVGRLRRGAEDPELAQELRSRLEAAARLAEDLGEAARPLHRAFSGPDAGVEAAARALVEAAEAFARGPDGSLGGLWSGRAGEAAARLLSGLLDYGAALPPVDARRFEVLVGSLVEAETVRVGGSTHPRLRILGAIEARLVRADRMILAGLEEGVWPQAAPTDPFLSRPMRERLGLPAPEQRIGLSAHDFAQAACAPEVVLLSCDRRGGQPAVPSRWVWRLETLVRGADLARIPDAAPRKIPDADDILDYSRTLDRPEGAPAFAKRPAPTPPVEVRPRKLSVTKVETWVRDPYAIYARHVLRLEPLDRPDKPAEAAARGSAVHLALERFAKAEPPPAPTPEVFKRLLLEALEEAGFGAAALAREGPVVANLAAWLAGFERDRTADDPTLFVETRGEATLIGPAGPFRLRARADRIEVRGSSGAVIDFKTGQTPTKKQVASHLAPQLTLTGAILARNGFPGAENVSPDQLLYVRLSGRRPPGEVKPVATDAAGLCEDAWNGLAERVAEYDRPEHPYRSWVAPEKRGPYGGDYDHLARVWEWMVVGDGETGGEDGE